jgi:hypothetical protein
MLGPWVRVPAGSLERLLKRLQTLKTPANSMFAGFFILDNIVKIQQKSL